MPKLDNKKVTIGQLAKLPDNERARALEPIIKANEEQLAKMASTIAEVANSNLVKTLKSFTPPTFPILDLLKNIKLPELPQLPMYEPPDLSGISLERYDPPVTIKKSDWEIKKESREAYMIELQIQILEQQLNLVKGMQMPQYDQNTGVIILLGKKIEIPLNTNLEMVCRIVLKNVANMKKKWSWDEIVEENRENIENYTQRIIYTAVRSINQKVALETQIKDFLISKPTSTVQLNPKFIAK